MPHAPPSRRRSIIAVARMAVTVAFALLGILSSSTASAQVVYEESFEGGLPGGIWQPKMSTVYPYTHQIETAIVHPAGGAKSWRVENRGGNPDIYGKHRAQLYTPKIIPADEGAELWSGFAMYIGPWPNVDTKRGAIVYQHKIGTGGPEVHLILKEGGKIELTVNSDQGSPPEKVRVGGTSFQLQAGAWHHFIVRQVRALDERGRLQLWHNGKRVYSYSGPAMMDGIARGKSGAVDISYGVYWGTDDRPGRTYVLYFDRLRVALGANQYAVVDPSRPGDESGDAGTSRDVGAELDAGAPEPDAKMPEPDAAMREPDAAVPLPDAAVPAPDAGAGRPDAGLGSRHPCQSSADCPSGEFCMPEQVSCPQGEACAMRGVCLVERDVTVRVEGCAAAGGWHGEGAGAALALVLLLLGALMRRRSRATIAALLPLVLWAPASALAAGDDAVVGWQLDFNADFATDPIWPAESVLTSVGGGTSRIDQLCTGGRKWSRSDPTGGSNPALRIFQDGDDSCLTGAATKPKHRAMFRPTELGSKFPYALDEHHWIGYRIYFPKDFASDWLHRNNVKVAHFSYQAEHNIHIAGDAKGPAYVVNNRYSLAPGGAQWVKEKEISLPTGRWIDVVSHVLRKRDNTGILEVWIDGVKEVSWHGIRTASDPDATGQSADGKNVARWKIGLYWGPIDRPVDFTIYLDDMKYAKGKSGYHVVAPSGGSQPPISDAAPIEPDAAVPAPDAAVPVLDAAMQEPDAAMPVPDAALPEPDAVAPAPDATAPTEADGGASQDRDVTVRVEGCAAAGALGSSNAGVALALVLLVLGVTVRRRGKGACGAGLITLLLPQSWSRFNTLRRVAIYLNHQHQREESKMN